jgi:hypothetical protein
MYLFDGSPRGRRLVQQLGGHCNRLATIPPKKAKVRDDEPAAVFAIDLASAADVQGKHTQYGLPDS